MGKKIQDAEETADPDVGTMCGSPILCGSVAIAAGDRYAGQEALVTETHQASLDARERALRKTIAKNSNSPSGAWGETREEMLVFG